MFVHNSMYGWSTLPYRMEDSYKDVVRKCNLELIFLKCWAFGEVKQIQRPTGVPRTGKRTSKKSEALNPDVIPGNDDVENVITHNVPTKSDRVMRK